MGFSGGGGGTSPQQSALLNNSSQIMIQNAINILKNNKNDSISDPTYKNIIKDLFSDSDGYNNTIDTGNTTAIFNSTSKVYDNGLASSSNASTGNTLTESIGGGQDWMKGAKVTLASEKIIISVTKSASSNATNVQVYNDESSNHPTGSIGNYSATYVGNVATFSSPITLPAGTYAFLNSNGGGIWAGFGDTTPTLPVNDADLSFVDGYWDSTAGGVVDKFLEIASIEVQGLSSDKILQTNMQTLSFTPSYFMIYCDKTLAGSGSLDCDISFNNGSNYQTAVALNTITSITNQGTQMILKINLKGTGLSNTASVSDYGVIFF